MDSMMAVEIRQILERIFDVYLSPQEIRTITFAKLFEMSNTETNLTADTSDRSERNNSLMFNIVQNEDFISEISTDFSIENEKSASQVFLIPGIDGCGTIFNHLKSHIKFSATTLHYNTGAISTGNNLSEMVDQILEQAILTRLRDKKEFAMVGYSFGSILAIELARRLENIGFEGRIVLIDGSPDQITLINKRYITFSSESAEDNNETEMQISVLNMFSKVYKIETSEKDSMTLEKCKTDEERFNTFAKYFTAQNSTLSLANLKILYTTIYKHLVIIKKYEVSTVPRIKSPVILLKPTIPSAPEAEEDYGLHKITSDVTVQYVEGSHITILKNSKVIAAINKEI